MFEPLECENLERVYFCYSNENIKNLIENNYKLIIDTENYHLSPISEIDNLPKDSFKIIFTDDLMTVSEYICKVGSSFTFWEKSNHNGIFIINTNRNSELLHSFLYDNSRYNIINLDYKDIQFKEYIKWLILLFSSSHLLCTRADFYDIADFLICSGVSTLHIKSSLETDNIDNVINAVKDNHRNHSHCLFLFANESTSDVWSRASTLYFEDFDIKSDIRLWGCLVEPNFNLENKFIAVSIIPYSYQKS